MCKSTTSHAKYWLLIDHYWYIYQVIVRNYFFLKK